MQKIKFILPDKIVWLWFLPGQLDSIKPVRTGSLPVRVLRNEWFTKTTSQNVLEESFLYNFLSIT